MKAMEISDSTASTSHEGQDQIHAAVENDKAKRFDYLLKQTEIFAHFMQNSKRKDPSEMVLKAKKGGKRKKIKDLNDDEEDKAIVAFEKTPDYIKGGEMRDYQIRGLNWMISLYENRINGILADEMGLGKTLQTISLLGYLKHFHGILGPHIVIVPKSTLQNWMNEFNRWCPSLKAVCFWAPKEERKVLLHNVLQRGKWNVCITSYETCLAEKTALKKFNWQYLVIDEAHRIKNEGTKLAEIVRTFPSTNRLLLTGTPLQNNLHELWSLLNFLLPEVFNSSEDFDEWFSSNQCLDDMSLVQRLHGVLKPFLLRRVKSDVEKKLLPKKEIKVYCRLSELQREWYKKVLLKDIDIVRGNGSSSKMKLENLLIHLRKCCSHPYLFNGAEPGPPYTTDYHLIENSGKMIILDKLLSHLKQNGSRVLLFSQMTRMLDILEDYCLYRDYKYSRLDGQTAHEDRSQMIDEYNAPNSEKFIFLISTRAGGLGINLASADAVIVYDSDYNPQVDLQAIDRAHRIGQTKQVHVYRLVVENTVDEKIIERAEVKLKLDRMVIQQGRPLEKSTAPNKDQIQAMICHGMKQIIESTYADMKDEDIVTILQRSEARTMQEEVGDGINLDMVTRVYEFEGENWREKQKEHHHNVEEIDFGPRRKRKAVEAVYAQATAKKKNTKKYPIVVNDYQFFPKRLVELIEKDKLYYCKINEDEDSDDAARQLKINNAEQLTEVESTEMSTLFQEAFTSWSKGDFKEYVKALVKFGQNDIVNISSSVSGKTSEEVIKYNSVFWSRLHELNNSQQILEQIERTQSREERKRNPIAQIIEKQRWAQIMQRISLKKVLDAKISSYEYPLAQLQIPYANGKRYYSEEADRFIICKAHEIGVDKDSVYKEIRAAIKEAPQFQSDVKLLKKTASAIKEHCASLFKLLKKDYCEMQYDRENHKPQNSAAKRKRNELFDNDPSPSKKLKTDVKPLSELDPKSPRALQQKPNKLDPKSPRLL